MVLGSTHTQVLVAVGCPSSCVKSSGSLQLRRHRHTIFELHWDNQLWLAHSCICLLKVQCLVHTSPWTGDIPGWYLLLRTVPFLLATARFRRLNALSASTSKTASVPAEANTFLNACIAASQPDGWPAHTCVDPAALVISNPHYWISIPLFLLHMRIMVHAVQNSVIMIIHLQNNEIHKVKLIMT